MIFNLTPFPKISKDNNKIENTNNNIIQEENIISTKHKQYYYNFTVYSSTYNNEKKYIVDKVKILSMEEYYIGEVGINTMEIDTISNKQINHSGFILADNQNEAENFINNYVFEIYKNK